MSVLKLALGFRQACPLSTTRIINDHDHYDHLSGHDKSNIFKIIKDFPVVLTKRPKNTDLTEYDIEVKNIIPVSLTN